MARATTPARRYATLAEAAEYLGVNPITVRRLIAAGDVTGYRLAGRSRVVRVDLNELDERMRPIPSARSAS